MPPRMATSSTRSGAFAMLCIIWGSTWLAIRIGLEGAPPFLSASLRFAVASVVLVLLAVVFRSKWPQNRTEWALVGFVGVGLFTADYGLIYWGGTTGSGAAPPRSCSQPFPSRPPSGPTLTLKRDPSPPRSC